MHSDIDALERIEILRGLRLGEFDVLIGINLLREGLDLPEVSLVAILDADKEGFLRSERSLIQTAGRAARNLRGKVIMYADTVTDSMRRAIQETDRRRKIQTDYNLSHSIVPRTVQKGVYDSIGITKVAEASADYLPTRQKLEQMDQKEKKLLAGRVEKEMKQAAKQLDFERAAVLRDALFEIRKAI